MKEQIFNLAEATREIVAVEHRYLEGVVILLHKSGTHFLNLNYEGLELEKLAADKITGMGFHYHIIDSIEQVDVIIGALVGEVNQMPNSNPPRYSDSDVKNIVLEMQNATMFAHSHNLSRFDTRIELQKVKTKWGI